MDQRMNRRRQRLKTPRAAAFAGILFSLLLLASLTLIRLAMPADPLDVGQWLNTSLRSVALALNLVPFSGIAFLWFIGVLRDRLGDYEDRFFATVLLGSGLLFLAMIFVAAATAGGLITLYTLDPKTMLESSTYRYGRAVSFQIMNVYAIKMAGVFMISTCTIGLRTGIISRWMVYLGYALALTLLFSIGLVSWVSLVFPLWVLLISIHILVENYRNPAADSAPYLANERS